MEYELSRLSAACRHVVNLMRPSSESVVWLEGSCL